MTHNELMAKLQGQKILIKGTEDGYEIRVRKHGVQATIKVVWIPDDDYYILKDNAISFRYDDWMFQLVSYGDYFMLSRVYSTWEE